MDELEQRLKRAKVHLNFMVFMYGKWNNASDSVKMSMMDDIEFSCREVIKDLDWPVMEQPELEPEPEEKAKTPRRRRKSDKEE